MEILAGSMYLNVVVIHANLDAENNFDFRHHVRPVTEFFLVDSFFC